MYFCEKELRDKNAGMPYILYQHLPLKGMKSYAPAMCLWKLLNELWFVFLHG